MPASHPAKILYTNKRMKSLDESATVIAGHELRSAPRTFDQGETQMNAKTEDQKQRISASHRVSLQLPREKRLSGSQKLIAKSRREEIDLNR